MINKNGHTIFKDNITRLVPKSFKNLKKKGNISNLLTKSVTKCDTKMLTQSVRNSVTKYVLISPDGPEITI